MTEVAHSIDLNLRQKLRDREYRRNFFWAETCARIAADLIALRKRRDLNQKEVADLVGTKQPAISRAEQADYHNRNLNAIRRIADELDARVRVIIEPAEDILKEYAGDNASLAAPKGPSTPEEVRETIRRSALEDFNQEPHEQFPLQLTGPKKQAGSAEGKELIN
jgi:transcriptional regulator with XRE-family HTH domain